MNRPMFRRIGISAALVAACASIGAYSLHQYGWGGVKKRIGFSTNIALALNSRSDEDDVDPNFITGENATPGRYVIALVESDDQDPAAYTGPYVPDPNDPNAPATDPTAPSPGRPRQQPVLVPATNDYTDTPQVAAGLCNDYGGTVYKSFSHVGCFAADMTEAEARAMSHDPRVISVAEDYAVAGTSTDQSVSDSDLWGLDQIDGFSNVRNFTYTYSNTASNVHAYIIDSGVDFQHAEFANNNGSGPRVTLDCNTVWGENFSDNNGHGTAVASIVGGIICGVAKNVHIHSVKVLNQNADAGLCTLTDGIDWVKWHHQSPAVANISISKKHVWFPGYNLSHEQDTAARRLANSGVTVVVAAGNDNVDVSQASPANVNELIVVGAADSNLARAKFYPYNYTQESNYGGGVDLFGPGLGVRAAQKGVGFRLFGGTSAAAPFVAGVAARYLSTHPYANHYSVQDWLTSNAIPKMQTSDLKGSPNKFVFAPPWL